VVPMRDDRLGLVLYSVALTETATFRRRSAVWRGDIVIGGWPCPPASKPVDERERLTSAGSGHRSL